MTVENSAIQSTPLAKTAKKQQPPPLQELSTPLAINNPLNKQPNKSIKQTKKEASLPRKPLEEQPKRLHLPLATLSQSNQSTPEPYRQLAVSPNKLPPNVANSTHTGNISKPK